MQPILSLNQIAVFRGKQKILNGINWQVFPRQHWVILGSNGSGKTCLLNTITGYLTPSVGTIQVLGKDYEAFDWRELRKSIGFVSSAIRQMINDDETAIDIVASGRDAQINSFGRMNASRLREAKTLLKKVDCQDLEKQSWSVLSQGERQRLLIARALMAKARILILDEPCTGLDPCARENFLHFLSSVINKVKDLNLILVTHHVEEIIPLFTHCLLLRNGSVLTRGKIKVELNNKNLSKVFGTSVRVTRKNNRYGLLIRSKRSIVI